MLALFYCGHKVPKNNREGHKNKRLSFGKVQKQASHCAVRAKIVLFGKRRMSIDVVRDNRCRGDPVTSTG